jgi:hypothetical protein
LPKVKKLKIKLENKRKLSIPPSGMGKKLGYNKWIPYINAIQNDCIPLLKWEKLVFMCRCIESYDPKNIRIT